MGKSRNQRSKHESSFLESVKSSLQQLIEEIGEIKVAVNHMRFAENGQHPFGWDSPWWHQTCEPYSMEPQPDSQRHDPFKILQALQDTSVKISPTCLRADATPFSPNPAKDVHQRDDILAYRYSRRELQKETPVELQTLVSQHEDYSCEVDGKGAKAITEVADCRRCPAQFWKTLYAKFAADSTTVCQRCGAAKCVCWQLFCRTCKKPADMCACTTCMVRRRRCGSCQWIEDCSSPFDEDLAEFDVPLPHEFSCLSCGSLDEDTEYAMFYNMESLKVCTKCSKIGYHSMRSCDYGLTCQTNAPCHSSCLNRFRGQLVCDECLVLATQPVTEFGWPELDEDSTRAFQSWYRECLEKLRLSITQQRNADVSVFLEDFQSMESLRQEAWRFHTVRSHRQVSE